MRLFVILLIGLLVAPWPSHGEDYGRFEISPGPPMILLDTLIGKTWRYDAAGQWVPIRRLRPKLPPQRKETDKQRWQREPDARRLLLKKSGPQPKPKSPARTLLDNLAPVK